jgi:DNA-binding transcriptional MerR regulator/ABC-type Fe3+-hydroxamate transport system substrate-binding protein
MRTIGEVAELVGVTIGTLRWYDEIGLLKPRARSSAGYRLYGQEELLRLREILIWRQLGFPLADIAVLIDEPEHDRREALDRQLALAGTQLDKFHSLTRGLEVAISALDSGRSLTDEDVFAGFAQSLADDGREHVGPHQRIATFALISGRSHHGVAEGIGRAPESAATRIVAIEPIRMAENLLALGVLPAGTWSYPSRFQETSSVPGLKENAGGEWPWSPFVEPVVRRRIRDLGVLGGDGTLIAELHPDVVFGWDTSSDEELSADGSREFITKTPRETPGFKSWLPEIAARLGMVWRAEELLTWWDARTLVLGSRLAGQEVSVLNVFGHRPRGEQLCVPTEEFEGQVFTNLGLELTRPDRGTPMDWSGLAVEPNALSELDAPTLFIGTFYLGLERVEELVSSRIFRALPAVQAGRLFTYDWSGWMSGWFSAHWQLRLVAHAFGLTQLRAGDEGEHLVAVADPRAGTLDVTPVYSDTRIVVRGRDVNSTTLELRRGEATRVSLPRAGVANLCRLPEAYSVVFEDTPPAHPFVHDQESAVSQLVNASAGLGRTGRKRPGAATPAPVRESEPKSRMAGIGFPFSAEVNL